jgi:cytochrome c oxidase subunit 2
LAVVVALVLGMAMPVLAQDGNPYPTTDPATPEGDDTHAVYKLIFWMAVVVFVLVQFLIVYSALRFRRRRNQTERPAQIHGNRTLEITWTLIPAVILIIIAIPTVQTIYDRYAAAEDGDMVIEVYGKQWWWEFHYPDITVGTDVQGNPIPLITANEIRIPEGTDVQFKLYSNNVIHSFWVPEFGGKMDVIPGHENIVSYTPRESGVYYGECAEFCGTAHSWMRFVVKVQPQDQFDAWVQAYMAGSTAASAPYVPNGDVTQTPAEFGTCGMCHNIFGTQRAIAAQAGIGSDPTSYGAGPNLSLFGCRDTIGAGVLENNAENLALWLSDPGLVKDGNYMHDLINGNPPMGVGNQGESNALTPEQIAVLVPYLLSLQPEGGCPEAGLENTYNTGKVASEATGVPAMAATPQAPAAETPAPAAPAGETPAPAAGPTTHRLEGGDIFFSTNEMTVAIGDTIELVNIGVLEHNFVIEGYNDDAPVDMPIGGEVIQWTVPNDLAPGQYIYYCAVPGHRANGMWGTITVTG